MLNPNRIKMLTFALLLVVATSTFCDSHAMSAMPYTDLQDSAKKPNIVLINVDDCDVDLVSDARLEHYPTLKQLASSSVRFTNCHVTTPLCGPSRACLFRSQYAHNTGYRTNRPDLDVGGGFTGGTQFFQKSGLAADQLPVWMQGVGYHTMMVGKYYQGQTDKEPVPGWDRFVAWGGNSYLGDVRFDIRPDGTRKAEKRVGYRTELETDDAIELLDEYSKDASEDKPFFLYVAPVAPHVGRKKENPVPDQWKDRFPNVELPAAANLNEQDVSDKPVVYRDTLPLSEKKIEDLMVSQRLRLIAMLGVDEMVQRIRRKIADMGQSDNTVIIFTSDHGYLMGHHRIHGKAFPLVEATRVPLWVHWPNTITPRDTGQLLAHIDISATVADIGTATLPDFVDGRSFKKVLLDDSIIAADAIRQSVLIENWESRMNSASKQQVVYSSIIKTNSMYTQWATGEHEFYDLESDPAQLDNGYESLDSTTKSSLEAELHSLRQGVSKDPATKATLSFPTVNRKFIGPAIELQGFVESVTRDGPVSVSIQRKSTGEYWNGASWGADVVTVPTESPVGAGLLYQWKAQPNVHGLNDGELLTIEVHAGEAGSQQTTTSKLEVVFDNTPPEVCIVRPLNQFVYPEFSNIGGEIADDQSPDDVRLFIRNLDTDEYYDGEEWDSAKVSVSVLINRQRGLWHNRYPIPEGRFEMTAIGKDTAGNWSEPSKPIRFVVDRKSKQRKLDEEIR